MHTGTHAHTHTFITYVCSTHMHTHVCDGYIQITLSHMYVKFTILALLHSNFFYSYSILSHKSTVYTPQLRSTGVLAMYIPIPVHGTRCRLSSWKHCRQPVYALLNLGRTQLILSTGLNLYSVKASTSQVS